MAQKCSVDKTLVLYGRMIAREFYSAIAARVDGFAEHLRGQTASIFYAGDTSGRHILGELSATMTYWLTPHGLPIMFGIEGSANRLCERWIETALVVISFVTQ